ncbi:MAG: Peptidyl-prolyl cis-trans isomerase SurA [Myxococcaceae bacterium]|nr:Peptidyl-prolyl cis-trans isomerase SurA [Myxococcaceae bacterium]
MRLEAPELLRVAWLRSRVRGRALASTLALGATLAGASTLLPGALSASLAQAEQESGEKPEGEVIERVVAVVNGDPLLLSELRTRAAPFLARVMQAPEAQRMPVMQQLYADLLTQLVDERLLEQEARKLSISITSTDVERAIQNVQRQSGLKDAEFWDAVRAQGFQPEQYKGDVRRQLVRLKVINQKVRSRINITEDDVKRRYEEQLRSARKSASFHVEHIFVPVEDDSVTKLSVARAKAEQLKATLTPDNFADAMKELGGGDLGWVQQGDLPEALASTLISLEPGQISEPVRGPGGLHIFLLLERKEGESAIGAFEQVKQAIFSELLDKAMAKQELAFLAELRKQSLISRRL